jgi:hypothetical protein
MTNYGVALVHPEGASGGEFVSFQIDLDGSMPSRPNSRLEGGDVR